jgi:hypothetical protein
MPLVKTGEERILIRQGPKWNKADGNKQVQGNGYSGPRLPHMSSV